VACHYLAEELDDIPSRETMVRQLDKAMLCKPSEQSLRKLSALTIGSRDEL